MKDFSPQTWFVRIVTNMRSALHSSAGEISKNSTTLMWQKKVLVNMFNSALSTTPPTLLDWPHVWILACIIFVFITLFFYVVILVKDKIRARSLILKNLPLGKRKPNKPSEIDMNPPYLVVHADKNTNQQIHKYFPRLDDPVLKMYYLILKSRCLARCSPWPQKTL